MSTDLTRRKYTRPLSGLSQCMRVNISKDSQSYSHKKQRIRKMNSIRLPKVQSEQPQTVYEWLDKFDRSIKQLQVGKSYVYPESKFLRSRAITSSQGYRTQIFMHKPRRTFQKYSDQFSSNTVSIRNLQSKNENERVYQQKWKCQEENL